MRMKRIEENCVKDLLLTNRTMGCGFVVLLNLLQSGSPSPPFIVSQSFLYQSSFSLLSLIYLSLSPLPSLPFTVSVQYNKRQRKRERPSRA